METDPLQRSLASTFEPPAIPDPPQGSTVETGTTVVGVTAADAVVLAADRRASLGGRFVTNKRTQKIEQVHPTAATALSGAVGHIQYFTRMLHAESRLYRDRRGTDLSVPALATLASNVLRQTPLHAVPILGGVDADGSHLYSLDGSGGRLEDDYVAGGSGMQLAYGVLERHFTGEESLAAGRRIAVEAIDSAAERDTASGNGLMLATITDEGVTLEGFDSGAEVGA